MATITVHCATDLSGVFQALDKTKKYLLKFDGKKSVIEEVPATGTAAFVDGELTDLTPAAGNVTVITPTGPVEVTPIADGTIDTAVTTLLDTEYGIITDANAP